MEHVLYAEIECALMDSQCDGMCNVSIARLSAVQVTPHNHQYARHC